MRPEYVTRPGRSDRFRKMMDSMHDPVREQHLPKPETFECSAEFDDQSAELIWNRYFERLLRFATSQMQGMSKATRDEEDITLSVLKSVCLSLRDGRSPINDDEGLWPLLVVICKRKIANQYAYQNRAKRQSSKSKSIDAESGLIEELHSKEIQPEMLAEFNERLEHLFSILEKEPLKKIALAKVQGFTNEEIAVDMKCSLSTVERKLRTIRGIWSHENEPA